MNLNIFKSLTLETALSNINKAIGDLRQVAEGADFKAETAEIELNLAKQQYEYTKLIQTDVMQEALAEAEHARTVANRLEKLISAKDNA